MRVHDSIGYAPLPRELRGKRNLAPKEPVLKDEGRFRSNQHRRGKERASEAGPSAQTSNYPRPEIPVHWRKTDIKYSKFGIEDFDFGYYNKTEYSGLETHIMNSYTNAIVQSLFYIIPLRAHAKSHITTSCEIEHCLLCELGFLSRMLEDAKGTNCQASNFCKVIGRKPQATALSLIDYALDGVNPDYLTMIQQFNRFVMEEMATEGSTNPNPVVVPPELKAWDQGSSAPPPVTQIFGMSSKTVATCGQCRAATERSHSFHVVDLNYPRKATFISSRAIPSGSLPPVLSVNAAAFTDDALKIWRDRKTPAGTQRFLTPEITVNAPGGLQDGESNDIKYKLRGVVFQVRVTPKESHLVAAIRIPDSERVSPKASPWYLFNDFVVQNVSEDEALGCPSDWKVPCILFLERQDTINRLDFTGLPSKLDPTILCRQHSIARNTDWPAQKHKVLEASELPTPGTVVAIDAEFVALQQEESEYRSDGTKKVIRPSLMTLARVSVLRGQGQSSGTPFMDDYIHTTDTIVNYLTEFSGIRFGDLDPTMSRHTLLPLKTVYKKLRLLVDLGCIFVGHGLPKDFRTI
ncbi:poly(A)-specific ribonuclease, partial [Tulasnella sp. 408]